MSIPRIPGYTEDATPSLANEWLRPEGDFPEELWPVDVLKASNLNRTTAIEAHEADGGQRETSRGKEKARPRALLPGLASVPVRPE
jgi:hypothetical protein